MATSSCHWLLMGKMKIGIYCCLIADILTKVLQKWSFSGLLQSIPFFCNLLIWLVTVVTKRQNLRKDIKKSTPQKLFGGLEKLKLCRIVSSNSLYKNIVVFFIAVAQSLWLLCQLKSFHWLTMGKVKIEIYCIGKSENCNLLLAHCRYFDKSFTEMFLE